MGRTEDALAQFRQAVTIDPNDAEAHNDLAAMLCQLGRADEAISHYRQALALAPDHAAASLGLGIVFAAVGRLEEAKRAFDAAITLAPKDANTYYQLGLAVRFASDDRHFLAMQQLAGEMDCLPLEGQIALHLALGKAFADAGDYGRSFHHLAHGNALKRRQTPYDEAKTLGSLERVRTVFTSELLCEKAGLGSSSSLPVFIVGMHRSGTTLVEQILASHPKCFGAGELAEMGAIVQALRGPGSTEFPEAVPSLSATHLRELAARYLGTISRLSATAERITDKMPTNFIYTGLIHLMLPNARFIHTQRDPRDTALSCFSTLFGPGLDYSCDLAELGRFYRGYQSLMAHWRNVLPEGVMLELDYEAIVQDLEGQARRIVGHCGLEWNDACLSFYRTERPVLTPSVGQVREPIYQRSVGRWRRYEKFLGPFLQALEGDGSPAGFRPE
jgi:tetratricopeptide (TPR) repeat protein